jgi:hypothetical protein
MAAEKIGCARCPLCHNKGARVSLSKSGLTVLTCNACHCQLFTRSEVSDSHVRALIITPEPGGVPGTEAPPPAPAPAPIAPPPPPRRLGLSFGLGGA